MNFVTDTLIALLVILIIWSIIGVTIVLFDNYWNGTFDKFILLIAAIGIALDVLDSN